jgi:hypothetical protein
MRELEAMGEILADTDFPLQAIRLPTWLDTRRGLGILLHSGGIQSLK